MSRADNGLTGRKIVVETCGGFARDSPSRIATSGDQGEDRSPVGRTPALGDRSRQVTPDGRPGVSYDRERSARTRERVARSLLLGISYGSRRSDR